MGPAATQVNGVVVLWAGNLCVLAQGCFFSELDMPHQQRSRTTDGCPLEPRLGPAKCQSALGVFFARGCALSIVTLALCLVPSIALVSGCSRFTTVGARTQEAPGADPNLGALIHLWMFEALVGWCL